MRLFTSRHPGRFIVAITLHNMPEGLAVGVGFGSENLGNAIPLIMAIGIQNIPEGLAATVAALNAGLGSLFYASISGIRAGLVETPWRTSAPGQYRWPSRSSRTRWGSPRAR